MSSLTDAVESPENVQLNGGIDDVEEEVDNEGDDSDEEVDDDGDDFDFGD